MNEPVETYTNVSPNGLRVLPTGVRRQNVVATPNGLFFGLLIHNNIRITTPRKNDFFEGNFTDMCA